MSKSGKGGGEKKDKRIIAVEDQALLRDICGPVQRNLQEVEHHFSDYRLRVEATSEGIKITGHVPGPAKAEEVLLALLDRAKAGVEPSLFELQGRLNLVDADMPAEISDKETISSLKTSIAPQTAGQRRYMQTLFDESYGLVFGTGPAGTGKTFLAVAMGAHELKVGRRDRLIVARPAVEAGEKLGFLPGDADDKLDPYMLPIWDALNELLGADEVRRRRDREEIEVAPLAFMRGRTLKNAFVIVDEAQNATIPQMKMVLTRLGRASRMVVTGDPSQTDLPDWSKSGLAHAMRILKDIKGVAQIGLTARDVVRHELVARIVEAYDADSSQKETQ